MCEISIIIPVYNAENYLNECMESILAQTFSEYEVLLIDDGSTDKSGIICDQYARKYKNVYVYHQKNSGQAVARNFGVKQAKGRYIWFVDSDDVILSDNALSVIQKEFVHIPDVIAFGWKEAENNEEFCLSPERFGFCIDEKCEKIQSGTQYLSGSLSKTPLYNWYPWIYLYRREYWINHSFEFPKGQKFEDLKLIYNTLLDAESIVKVDQAFYGYRVGREGSTTTNLKISTLEDGMRAVSQNVSEILDNDAIDLDLKKKLLNNFSCSYFALMISSTKLKKNEQKIFKEVLKKNFWVSKYTTSRSQKIVRTAICVFGITVVQKMLEIRRVLKHGK